MAKKSHNIPMKNETPVPGKYSGAEWTGPDGLMSTEFGILSKGKLYSIDETRARNSNDWRPVYESIN